MRSGNDPQNCLNGFRALMPALGAAVIAVSDSEAEISEPSATGLTAQQK